MKTNMNKQIECDLPACKRKFVPSAVQQRFCCVKHRNLFHQNERTRIMRIVREMGVGK
jgi:hypothetical protein